MRAAHRYTRCQCRRRSSTKGSSLGAEAAPAPHGLSNERLFVSEDGMDAYDPQAIETKWQRVWDEARAFNTPDSGAADGREFYLLEMLPYPSGTLHVGQVRNYTQGDALTHFHR